MSRPTLADRVLEVLAEHEPGRLLDIPAGGAPIVDGAGALGWNVVPADLYPPAEGFRGIQADACAPLPFRDASFDAVVSMEGIEHFENQAAFVREIARVLKPGGLLVLTTPNVMHLGARWSIFWTGQRAMKRGFISERTTVRGREPKRIYHGHAFLIDVVRLRYLFEIEGLSITGLRRGRLSEGSIVLAPLVPIVWLQTRLAFWLGRRTRGKEGHRTTTPEIERDLAQLLDSPALLFSRQLIAVARKRGERGTVLEPVRRERMVARGEAGETSRSTPAARETAR